MRPLLVLAIEVLLLFKAVLLHIPQVFKFSSGAFHQSFVWHTGFHIDHFHSLFTLPLLDLEQLIDDLLFFLQVILDSFQVKGFIGLDYVMHHFGYLFRNKRDRPSK